MKRIMIFVLSICLCFVFAGCRKKVKNELNIVTSCYPVYIMALNITRDVPGINLENMCDINTGCLHDFQLKSDDLKKIERSSVFIINGAGMESFLDKITKELSEIKIIDSSYNINLIKNSCKHNHEHKNHEHNYNSHIWLSISNYINQVRNITQKLSEFDPENSQKYQYNCDQYIQKLENLKSEFEENLYDITNKKIVTFHDAFPYFEQEFGLEIAGVINHEHENESSLKDLKKIIEIIKENNIKNIFVEPQYNQNVAQIISGETGAEIFVLDPAVTGEKNPDSYINIMKKNLQTLIKSLK